MFDQRILRIFTFILIIFEMFQICAWTYQCILKPEATYIIVLYMVAIKIQY